MRGSWIRLRSLQGRGAWWSGSVWALLVAASVGALAFARVLTPSPEGHGTHTQLGLAPCAILAATGYPCPACGLTTSFAHLARLNLAGALRANLAGALFFVVACAFVPIGLVGMARRMPVLDTLAALRGDVVAFTLVAATFGAWICKVLAAWLG